MNHPQSARNVCINILTLYLSLSLCYCPICDSFRARGWCFHSSLQLSMTSKAETTSSTTEFPTGKLLKGLRETNQDPKVAANNEFVDWLAENGVWVSTTSGWGRAPHPLVIATNTEDDGESCGRGLLAKEGMSQGELMMTIPLDLCLTRSTAQALLGSDIVPDDMDEYLAIALLLMTELLKGTQSRWAAYFSVLPDVQEVYPSYLWSDEELGMLQGSPTRHASKSLRAKLEREYTALNDTVLQKLQGPAEDLTFELFTWAFVMLLSRAARLTSKQGGETLALVPYADLMNHNPYSSTYIDAQWAGMPLISRKEEVAVYADRTYKKFEQVFINYGEKSNADLVLLYGFALDQNPFDAVDVTVGLSTKDRLYKQKKEFLEKSGRGAVSVRFPLQQRRYPSELVDFMRLLLVEPVDLGMQTLSSTDFNEPLTPSLERRVLSTLIGICSASLAAYPESLQQDEALVADKALFATLSRHQRMAVRLRASEKRILADTIAALEEELQTLPSALTDADVDIGLGPAERQGRQRKGAVRAAGRSFDVLARRTTVQSAQGPADWVDFTGAAPVEKEKSAENVSNTLVPEDAATYERKSDQRRARRRK